MIFLIIIGLPFPYCATSNAARPVTCGAAWLVPMKPVRRFPAAHAVIRGTSVVVNPASLSLAQRLQTHDAMSGLPHGQPLLGTRLPFLSSVALPPGAATPIEFLPKLEKNAGASGL